jgi:hypothetical protein
MSTTKKAARFPSAQAVHFGKESPENVDIEVAKLTTAANTNDLPSRKVEPPSS